MFYFATFLITLTIQLAKQTRAERWIGNQFNGLLFCCNFFIKLAMRLTPALTTHNNSCIMSLMRQTIPILNPITGIGLMNMKPLYTRLLVCICSDRNRDAKCNSPNARLNVRRDDSSDADWETIIDGSLSEFRGQTYSYAYILSCLVHVGGVNRMGNKSLSSTENFETVLISLEMRFEQSFVLSRPSFEFATRTCLKTRSNRKQDWTKLLSLQYIKDYWKQSWLVASSVHTTDKTREDSFVWSVLLVWTKQGINVQNLEALNYFSPTTAWPNISRFVTIQTHSLTDVRQTTTVELCSINIICRNWREAEHATDNCGILDAPSIVTDSSPLAVKLNLHSTITVSSTTCQPHAGQHLTCVIIIERYRLTRRSNKNRILKRTLVFQFVS